MIKRPIGVTIVCWVLIITSIVAVVGGIFVLSNPDKVALLQAQSSLPPLLFHFYLSCTILSPVVNFVIALFMLRQCNWARHVYLIFNSIIYISALVIGSDKLTMFFVIIIFLIFLYFLYNKTATRYFTQAKA